MTTIVAAENDRVAARQRGAEESHLKSAIRESREKSREPEKSGSDGRSRRYR